MLPLGADLLRPLSASPARASLSLSGIDRGETSHGFDP
jgi:hypothetical protein